MMDGDGFYKSLLDHLHDGVYFVDRERRISYWNLGAERITGFGAQEVVGRQCMDNILRHVDETGAPMCLTGCALSRCMEHGRPEEVEAYLHHRDGHRVPVRIRVVPLRDKEGRVAGAVEIFSDDGRRIQARRRIEELEALAYADTLTGLASRRFAEISLRLSADQWERYGWPFGVILLDVNDFKTINDTHGHAAGDRILKMTALTLRGSTRPSDVVARWGGDEFLALLQNVDQPLLDRAARKYEGLVRTSGLRIGSAEVGVTLSAGAALVLPGDTPESLLQRADEALYQVKRRIGFRRGEPRLAPSS